MGFLDTVSKAKAFDEAQSMGVQKAKADSDILNAMRAQKQMDDQSMRDEAIFKAGVEGGLAQGMAGPTMLTADAPVVPEGVNVTNDEIAVLQSMGVKSPTMEDVMFLRKQASLDVLQGGMGAAADTNASGLAKQMSNEEAQRRFMNNADVLNMGVEEYNNYLMSK